MARDAHGGGLLSVRNLDYNVRGHLSPQPQQLQQQQQQGQRQSQQQQQQQQQGRPPPLVQVQVGVVQQQGMTGQKRQQELLLRRGQQSNWRAGWVKVYRGNGSKAAAGTGSVKAGGGTAAAAQALGGSSSAAANYFAAAGTGGSSSSSSSGSKLRAGGVNVQVAQQHARDLVWNGQAIYA